MEETSDKPLLIESEDAWISVFLNEQTLQSTANGLGKTIVDKAWGGNSWTKSETTGFTGYDVGQ